MASAPAIPRQLLVDISVIASHDAGTGIQRTVRSLLLELQRSPPPGYVVRPVQATRKTPYRYATNTESDQHANEVVSVRPGDIFLGLDLSSHIAIYRTMDFILWRSQSVRFVFIIYDLLPALRPEWFTQRAQKRFLRWLTLVALHGDILCGISRSVIDDTKAWLVERLGIEDAEQRLDWIHLGAEFPALCDTAAGIPPSLEGMSPATLAKSILMVGTVEPRKGHAQVLDAFEALWKAGHENILVIVGRQGWNVEPLALRLRNHPEIGKRLIWLTQADDTQLGYLYTNLGGLIMASQAEGFGLPLVEAAHYGMPVLARDIPVFHEVAGTSATYFNASSGIELSPQLAAWLQTLSRERIRASHSPNLLSWAASADQLKNVLARVA